MNYAWIFYIVCNTAENFTALKQLSLPYHTPSAMGKESFECINYVTHLYSWYMFIWRVLWPLAMYVTHVPWSVCLCVGHTGELYKTGWTDGDGIWGADLHGPGNLLLDGNRDFLRGKGILDRVTPWVCPTIFSRLAATAAVMDITTQWCGWSSPVLWRFVF